MPGYNMEQYLEFFGTIVDLIFKKLQNGCYAIFIQTDYQRLTKISVSEFYEKMRFHFCR